MRRTYRGIYEVWEELPEGYEVINVEVTARNKDNNLAVVRLHPDEDGDYYLVCAFEYIGESMRDLTVRREE